MSPFARFVRDHLVPFVSLVALSVAAPLVIVGIVPLVSFGVFLVAYAVFVTSGFSIVRNDWKDRER